jgi:hypothetical protein
MQLQQPKTKATPTWLKEPQPVPLPCAIECIGRINTELNALLGLIKSQLDINVMTNQI